MMQRLLPNRASLAPSVISQDLIFGGIKFILPPLQRCIFTKLPTPENTFTERSHTAGQLTRDDIGKRVKLYGWVQYTRFDNKIIALRDSYGVTQCVLDKKELVNLYKTIQISNESVISVAGVVKARPTGQKNDKVASGDIEISVDRVDILSLAAKNLPILTRDETKSMESSDVTRLKYRYLDLRSSRMQQALRLKSTITHMIRQQLHELKFVECETPTLFGRTPGGANEFIVPTQVVNKFYSLVQSPQQLKQLLMVGGLDRYFQICRCYRDELGRSDRQPEFTQVDIELSFTKSSLVMNLIENILQTLFREISLESLDKVDILSCFGENSSLRKIPYKEAFSKYGNDKPDTRFDWLIDEKENGLVLEIPHQVDTQLINNIIGSLRVTRNYSPSPPILVSCTDLGVKLSSKDISEEAREILGLARIAIAKKLNDEGLSVYKRKFGIVWVTDFPLFTKDTIGKLTSNHHPFTAPTQETIHQLETDPMNVIGQHYDLVINGQEVAGGSIRIHDANLQKQIFSILQVDSGKFEYFLEALRSGCPPHGGIAIGLDRLIAILLNKETIKDVIAFPKSSTGRDLMTNSPQEVDPEVRQLYHIK